MIIPLEEEENRYLLQREHHTNNVICRNMSWSSVSSFFYIYPERFLSLCEKSFSKISVFFIISLGIFLILFQLDRDVHVRTSMLLKSSINFCYTLPLQHPSFTSKQQMPKSHHPSPYFLLLAIGNVITVSLGLFDFYDCRIQRFLLCPQEKGLALCICSKFISDEINTLLSCLRTVELLFSPQGLRVRCIRVIHHHLSHLSIAIFLAVTPLPY